MLAVVEDQNPQVLLFQISIGDAKVVMEAGDGWALRMFQFSIGDASPCT